MAPCPTVGWADMRIFLAGASGLIGVRLVPLLVEQGHEVAGMTRSADKAAMLTSLGAVPVVCDVYEASGLTEAVSSFEPDLVLHQLTDLPDSVADMNAYAARNRRIRQEGTRNLLAAAVAAGASGFIAQSVAWEQPNDESKAVTAEYERMVLAAGGVVIRYGAFYGPGTYYPAPDRLPKPPRISLDDAAAQTLVALEAPAGATLVIDDRALA